MDDQIEVCIKLEGKWVEWAAFGYDDLGEEYIIARDKLSYDDIPDTEAGDNARMFGVVEAISAGLDGLGDEYVLIVTNKNPGLRSGEGEWTDKRARLAMLADNGLDMPEA
jgi:hypothetical protein